MSNIKKYGWVSQQSIDAGHGYAIYLNPSGEKIVVSCVTNSPTDKGGYGWDDTVCVGELGQYVRTFPEK